MSRQIYESSGLFVTRFAGPASEGEDRRRWQFTTPRSYEYVQLTAAEVERLIAALSEDVES